MSLSHGIGASWNAALSLVLCLIWTDAAYMLEAGELLAFSRLPSGSLIGRDFPDWPQHEIIQLLPKPKQVA